MIAIDGPVASGKTTVGELLSSRLGYRLLDTGLMYRGVTWLALKQGISPTDEERLGALARTTPLRPAPDGKGLLVGDRVLTWELRTPEVERSVSQVSEVLSVRQAMVQQQREIAEEGPIVMVGRDIGTVVLPDAELKVFLVASSQERAKRRSLQLQEEGSDTDYHQVLQELEARDKLDSQRAHSPLRPASDARLLDTGGLDVEQVVEEILALIETRQ